MQYKHAYKVPQKRTIHTDDSNNSVTLQQVVIAAYNIFLSSLSYITNVKLFQDNLLGHQLLQFIF